MLQLDRQLQVNFNVLLAVHLGVFLIINQLDAQIIVL